MERKLQLFLETLNSRVWFGKVKIVVLGGNLLIELELREDTIDIYIATTKRHNRVVSQALNDILMKEHIPYNIFVDGNFYDVVLPDIWERSTPIPTPFKHINLRFLNINDQILLKLGRNVDRDKKDIAAIMKKKKIDVGDLLMRFRLYIKQYVGNEGHKKEFVQNVRVFCATYDLPFPEDALSS